jgi:hypothetical protein
VDPTEKMVKRLMAAVKCSVCGSHYESDKVDVLGHQEELWFLSVTCVHCRTQGLVAALIKDARSGEAPEVVELSTDISDTIDRDQTDESKPSGSPVNGDDLLDMHEFLTSFDGDFHHLFDNPDNH